MCPTHSIVHAGVAVLCSSQVVKAAHSKKVAIVLLKFSVLLWQSNFIILGNLQFHQEIKAEVSFYVPNCLFKLVKWLIFNVLNCGYIVNTFISRGVYRTWEARANTGKTIRKNNFLCHVREDTFYIGRKLFSLHKLSRLPILCVLRVYSP